MPVVNVTAPTKVIICSYDLSYSSNGELFYQPESFAIVTNTANTKANVVLEGVVTLDGSKLVDATLIHTGDTSAIATKRFDVAVTELAQASAIATRTSFIGRTLTTATGLAGHCLKVGQLIKGAAVSASASNILAKIFLRIFAAAVSATTQSPAFFIRLVREATGRATVTAQKASEFVRGTFVEAGVTTRKLTSLVKNEAVVARGRIIKVAQVLLFGPVVVTGISTLLIGLILRATVNVSSSLLRDFVRTFRVSINSLARVNKASTTSKATQAAALGSVIKLTSKPRAAAVRVYGWGHAAVGGIFDFFNRLFVDSLNDDETAVIRNEVLIRQQADAFKLTLGSANVVYAPEEGSGAIMLVANGSNGMVVDEGSAAVRLVPEANGIATLVAASVANAALLLGANSAGQLVDSGQANSTIIIAANGIGQLDSQGSAVARINDQG